MKIYLAVIAVLAWFALIAQFCINLNTIHAPTGEIIIRYFCYFTVITNLLIAVCSTALVLSPFAAIGQFFSRQTTRAAMAMYIFNVALIYNIVLRPTAHPHGLGRVADEIFHVVVPVLYLIYWYIFVPKDKLKWNSFWSWLIMPLVYVFIIFIRGAFSKYYPYPFFNVVKIGYQHALINAFFITIAFLLVSLGFIGIGKLKHKRV